MRKLKLLIAACALLLGAGQTWAQTDVTSTYITNADFASIDGWTQDHSAQYWSLGNGLIGTYVVANSYTSSTDDTHLATEYCLGMQCRWSTNYANFTQTKENVTFPAGAYTISYDVQNTNTSTTSATYNNNFFVKVGETTYSDTKNEWMSGSSAWTTHTISFTLDEETTANFMISFGYGTGSNNFGSGNTPHLYVSHLAMTFNSISRPTAVSIDESLALTMGGTATLTPTYTPSDANTDTDITWTTDAATVATVDNNGVVTAVGPGTATITATTANGKEATCAVTVSDVTAAAAPSFYATSIENGIDYYLYNAAEGKFLGTLKEGWGTQAALTDHGIPFTVTLTNGKYTLDSHTYNSSTAHYLNDGWVDGGSANYNITSLGEGKFSISIEDGSVFLSANKANTIVGNSAPSANSVLAQWYFVSKENLESAFANATDASPVDATFYIGDPDFSRNHIIQLLQNGKTTQNPGNETYPWEYTVSNYHFKGGVNGNMCAETYQNGGGKIYQILNNVRNGKYVLKCQGFHNGSNASYLYANDEKVELAVLNANGENTAASMDGASNAFTAGQYNNELTVYVTDGTLTIGIDNASSNWACFDNFELYYCGPTIGGEAEELPETAMTADKWYYFDVPVDGDYDFTVTTLNDIVYTTDGTILIENESTVTDHFESASVVALTEGRYYVKSASAQILAFAPHSFSYEVGEANLSVVDGRYTSSQTFTVTFPDATTNDPDGVAALVENSTATVNGSVVALTAVEGGFSLDLGTLTPSTDYTIAIPGGVYGYASGESYNEAISLTVHTPVVLDGVYCLLDPVSKLFLGRGAAWGTEAVVDKYGIPFNLVTDATGVSSIEFVDWTGVYLYKTNDNGMFTDNTSTGWQFVKVADNVYTLKTATGDLYAKVDDGTYGKYVHAVEGAANATAWTLVTKAQRDEAIAAYPKENLKNVVTAAGLLSAAMAYMAANHITDIEAAAIDYVNANYQEIDRTSLIGTAKFAGSVGDWAWNQVRGHDGQPAYGNDFAEVWCATGSFTQTIDKANLPAGIYKLTVQGYERRKANDAATALYNAGYNLVSTYLAANGEQVRFTDWNEVAGKPTNTGNAVTAFNNGEAVNTVFVYLDGNTDLTITVKKPNYIWDCWAIFNNFTLTRYDDKVVIDEAADYTPKAYDRAYVELKRTIKADTWNSFVVPFEISNEELKGAFGENVEVAEYSEDADANNGDNSTVEFNKMENPEIAANTPVLLKTPIAGTSYTFFERTITIGDAKVEGNAHFDFVGTYAASTIIAEGDYFIGSNQLWKSEGNTTIAGTRAYIKAKESGEGARIAKFSINGNQATAIAGLEVVGTDNGKIYNLNGQEVQATKKGLYIQNGKKVVVK